MEIASPQTDVRPVYTKFRTRPENPNTHLPPANLQHPATVDLTGTTSVTEAARAEGWTPDTWTAALVDRIGVTERPLGQQATRLQALAGIATGTSPDNVTGEELARHYAISCALHERFSLLAADCANSGKGKAAVIYASAAISAQRACLSVLSALESLKQANRQAS